MKFMILVVAASLALTACGESKVKFSQVPKGEQGPKGDTGDKGEKGDQGVKGDKGDQGLAGLNGTNGKDGVNGTNGTNGANGSDGKDGKNGLNFYYGTGVPSNSFGVDEETHLDKSTLNLYKKVAGVWVLQGNIKGADGLNGTNGLNFLSGTVNPAPTVGVDDELYYNVVTYDLFKKVAGVWTLVGNLKGPKGDKGDKGDQGIQGIQGLMGATGAQGLKGDKGDKGATGSTGATGAQGIQGQTGAQGIQGVAGPMGPQGPAGKDGKDGVCVATPNLKIYSNIPQNTCHQLPGTTFYVFHSGPHIWFKKYSNCSHGSNEEGVLCARVSQYTDDGDSSVCWIGNKQYTVMGTGSSLKVYETTFTTN